MFADFNDKTELKIEAFVCYDHKMRKKITILKNDSILEEYLLHDT
jgi:hypothetical protein